MKDANGNATRLGIGEGIAISHTAGAKTVLSSDGLDSESLLATETSSKGTYAVTVKQGNAAANGTDVVTFTGSGGVSSSLTQNVSVSIVATEDSQDLKLTLTDATGYYASDATGPALGFEAADGSSHSITATVGSWSGSTFTAATANATDATVYPIKVTGNGLSYMTSVTVAAKATSGKFTLTGTIGAYSAKAEAYDYDGSVTISYAAPVISSVTALGSPVITSAEKGTVSITAIVGDQYGNNLANEGVKVAVTGRNTKSATLSTNADGAVSYSYTDAGTIAASDAVVFTSVSDDTLSSDDVTITWGTVVVSTVAVTGGSTADTIAGTTTFPISTGDGAEGGAVQFTATVKDSLGNVLAGVPVTFTTDVGATAAVVVTKTTNY